MGRLRHCKPSQSKMVAIRDVTQESIQPEHAPAAARMEDNPSKGKKNVEQAICERARESRSISLSPPSSRSSLTTAREVTENGDESGRAQEWNDVDSLEKSGQEHPEASHISKDMREGRHSVVKLEPKVSAPMPGSATPWVPSSMAHPSSHSEESRTTEEWSALPSALDSHPPEVTIYSEEGRPLSYQEEPSREPVSLLLASPVKPALNPKEPQERSPSPLDLDLRYTQGLIGVGAGASSKLASRSGSPTARLRLRGTPSVLDIGNFNTLVTVSSMALSSASTSLSSFTQGQGDAWSMVSGTSEMNSQIQTETKSFQPHVMRANVSNPFDQQQQEPQQSQGFLYGYGHPSQAHVGLANTSLLHPVATFEAGTVPHGAQNVVNDALIAASNDSHGYYIPVQAHRALSYPYQTQVHEQDLWFKQTSSNSGPSWTGRFLEQQQVSGHQTTRPSRRSALRINSDPGTTNRGKGSTVIGSASATASNKNSFARNAPSDPVSGLKVQDTHRSNENSVDTSPIHRPASGSKPGGGEPNSIQDPDPKQCDNCKTRSTPSWRRCPEGRRLLCNACGLYMKLHARPRPFTITKDGTIKIQRSIPEHAPCSNCHTRTTPVWKKGPRGEPLCNTCGTISRQQMQHHKKLKGNLEMLSAPGLMDVTPGSLTDYQILPQRFQGTHLGLGMSEEANENTGFVQGAGGALFPYSTTVSSFDQGFTPQQQPRVPCDANRHYIQETNRSRRAYLLDTTVPSTPLAELHPDFQGPLYSYPAISPHTERPYYVDGSGSTLYDVGSTPSRVSDDGSISTIPYPYDMLVPTSRMQSASLGEQVYTSELSRPTRSLRTNELYAMQAETPYTNITYPAPALLDMAEAAQWGVSSGSTGQPRDLGRVPSGVHSALSHTSYPSVSDPYLSHVVAVVQVEQDPSDEGGRQSPLHPTGVVIKSSDPGLQQDLRQHHSQQYPPQQGLERESSTNMEHDRLANQQDNGMDSKPVGSTKVSQSNQKLLEESVDGSQCILPSIPALMTIMSQTDREAQNSEDRPVGDPIEKPSNQAPLSPKINSKVDPNVQERVLSPTRPRSLETPNDESVHSNQLGSGGLYHTRLLSDEIRSVETLTLSRRASPTSSLTLSLKRKVVEEDLESFSRPWGHPSNSLEGPILSNRTSSDRYEKMSSPRGREAEAEEEKGDGSGGKGVAWKEGSEIHRRGRRWTDSHSGANEEKSFSDPLDPLEEKEDEEEEEEEETKNQERQFPSQGQSTTTGTSERLRRSGRQASRASGVHHRLT